MKRNANIIGWLTLLIVLNAGSAALVYWQQSRKLEALCVYTLAENIDKYLLECRRQEKNFFLRTSMEAIQSYNAKCDSTSTLITRIMQKRLPPTVRTTCSELTDQMDAYQKAFRATSIYRRDHPVGNGMISMMHLCTEAARKCHALVASIVAESEQQYLTVSRTAGTITLILLIGAPLLSILIAANIVRQVTWR